MWQANPTWGSPRIVGALRKLGIAVATSTMEQYRPRPKQPPSPTWKTFVKNHIQDVVALDVLVVPTVTFRVLFVLVLLAHERRVLHCTITEHSTAQGTAHQVVSALPWEEAPRSLVRDRDRLSGTALRQRVEHMEIEAMVMARRGPWPHLYVERLIGSIRRACLEQVILLHERHLQRLLTSYVAYDHRCRTHLSLAMDCPKPRPIQLPEREKVIAVPDVGGLHHHDARAAASPPARCTR
jgi:putative transposase